MKRLFHRKDRSRPETGSCLEVIVAVSIDHRAWCHHSDSARDLDGGFAALAVIAAATARPALVCHGLEAKAAMTAAPFRGCREHMPLNGCQHRSANGFSGNRVPRRNRTGRCRCCRPPASNFSRIRFPYAAHFHWVWLRLAYGCRTPLQWLHAGGSMVAANRRRCGFPGGAAPCRITAGQAAAEGWKSIERIFRADNHLTAVFRGRRRHRHGAAADCSRSPLAIGTSSACRRQQTRQGGPVLTLRAMPGFRQWP